MGNEPWELLGNVTFRCNGLGTTWGHLLGASWERVGELRLPPSDPEKASLIERPERAPVVSRACQTDSASLCIWARVTFLAHVVLITSRCELLQEVENRRRASRFLHESSRLGTMAAIAADTEKSWSRLVSFSLPSGSGYVEKARKAASSTVQFSHNLLRSTGQAAWSAGTSLLVYVRSSKADRDTHIVDLEGGPPATPKSLS